jgi:hypothetical protein
MKNSTSRYRAKALVLVCFFFILAAGFWAFKVLIRAPEVVFCEGQDPDNGALESVRFVDNGKDVAAIRVLKIGSDTETTEYEDAKGLIHRDASGRQPSRISVTVGSYEKLQIYRECGAQPICRFERVRYLSADQREAAQAKINKMDYAAFEARRGAAVAAQKFSELRSQILEIDKKQKKANGKEKRELQARLKRLNEEAAEAAGRMHSIGADAFSMKQQTEAAREKALARGTDIQTKDLVPSQVEKWCVNTERSKMKF